jgi:nucleotide-binding universal stress UspA family protein
MMQKRLARRRRGDVTAGRARLGSRGRRDRLHAGLLPLLRLWEQEACERLRDAFDQAFGGMPSGTAARQLMVRGAPGPALVELACQRDDLLVVGYGGRSRLGYAGHGSITRYCLAHARCPVLAVPPPELIRELRPWRHHWRPEDLAVPLAG